MSDRILRVNQLIKKELSRILLKEFDFPQDVLATLTRVETLPNLEESKVWISVVPQKDTRRILEILDKNIYVLQQKLNKRLRMRPIPRIRFLGEEKTGEAGRIEEILEEIKSLKKEIKRANIKRR